MPCAPKPSSRVERAAPKLAKSWHDAGNHFQPHLKTQLNILNSKPELLDGVVICFLRPKLQLEGQRAGVPKMGKGLSGVEEAYLLLHNRHRHVQFHLSLSLRLPLLCCSIGGYAGSSFPFDRIVQSIAEQ